MTFAICIQPTQLSRHDEPYIETLAALGLHYSVAGSGEQTTDLAPKTLLFSL